LPTQSGADIWGFKFMASPQTENGYTKIANELFEHLLYDTKISVGELKLLLFVIRKTYGYNKIVDKIPLSQFVKGIKYDRSNVCKIINSLVAKQLLSKSEKGYKLNKNWEEWVVVKQPLVAKQPTGSGNLDNKLVAKQPHSKERKKLTKEIITQSVKEKNMFNSKEYIKGLINNPRRDLHIIGLYYEFRQEEWPAIEAVQYLIKKELQPAKALKGYTDEQIIKTMTFLNNRVKQYKLEKWTLATVINYIGEIVNGKV